MTNPWQTIDCAQTDEGPMRLVKRGTDEFLIQMDDYVLMNSRLNLTEIALGQSACGLLSGKRNPKVLIGGLGMAFTLRAALDALPSAASVVVAELNPVVVTWCRGPLSELTGAAADDPRVDIRITDVADLIAGAASSGSPYDAIVLDLYQGTHDANSDRKHPFYSRQALDRTRRALVDGGVFAVWTETTDTRFEQRLERIGFTVQRTRPGKGGPRHTVYLATAGKPRRGRKRRNQRR